MPARRLHRLEELRAGNCSRLDVRGVRSRLGWTQRRLAKALGVHATTVQRWESGARVPAELEDRLRKLSSEAPNPVRAVRQRLGVTQTELARQLGVSGALVSRWEHGSGVPTAHANALAELVRGAGAGPDAEWLRRERVARGLSIRQLASRLGCQPAHVSEWEKGRRSVPADKRAALTRELTGRARTASRDQDVLELVRRCPGLSLSEIEEHFPAHHVGAVHGSLKRHVLAKRLFRAKGVTSRGNRPLVAWRYYAEPHPDMPTSATLTGSVLRTERVKRGWNQTALAAAIGVTRKAVEAWEELGDRPIPRARMVQVVDVLGRESPPSRPATRPDSALPDLRDRRMAAGFTQAELAQQLGYRNPTPIVKRECGDIPVSPELAKRILELFETAAAERVSAEELREGRRRAGWSQQEFARRLGVGHAWLSRWERGLAPIPSRFSQAIRMMLETAPVAERPQPIEHLRERREQLRCSQRELALRLDVPTWRVNYWERGGGVPPDVREQLEHELDSGIPAPDRAEARQEALLAIALGAPGIPPRRAMERLRSPWHEIRAAIETLEAAGKLHRRLAHYVDGAGRERWRNGLYVGPAAQSEGPEFSADELIRRREELFWSQGELARRLGIAQEIVWRWEQGITRPAPERVDRIEAVLRVGEDEAGELFGRLGNVEDRLLTTRERLGLSKIEMSRRLGVDAGSYSAWESGERRISTWRRRKALATLDRLESEATPAGISGAEIARRRTALGWSKGELARRLGVAAPTVTGWEHGKFSPAHDRVHEIIRVFDAHESATARA
jgi:transcriptional regulator with XRE-family HTH domain